MAYQHQPTQKRPASQHPTRAPRTLLSITAFALLGAFGALYLRHEDTGGRHSRVEFPETSATPLRPDRAKGAAPPSASGKALAQPPKAASSPTRSKADRERVENWLKSAREYRGNDRAEVLDAALKTLLAGGAKSVFEIEDQLAELSVYEQEGRAAAFHALASLGKELADSSDPEAGKALEAIQRMAKAELELPSLIEPNPELDIDALPEAAQHELVHRGVVVEEDGAFWQPTTLNKLPVVRMLRTLGGAESLAQLERLSEVEDNPVGLQFAAREAIELAHN